MDAKEARQAASGDSDDGRHLASERVVSVGATRRSMLSVGLALPVAGSLDQRRAAVALTEGDARGHGVVGDGLADDTRAVQSYLDWCASHNRIAAFGAMAVRTTGPLFSRGVGIVFDAFNHSGGLLPGFHPEGRDYTALTITGAVVDLCVNVIGSGRPTIGDAGELGSDARPRVNGIAFGSPTEPFVASIVRSVRIFGLAGFGVRFARCWDSSFIAISVEECGTQQAYAFDVTATENDNCNECVWHRVQVESAVICAVRIDPRTLSSTFDKIHSERCVGAVGRDTWMLGGSCVFNSVRLSARNPRTARAVLSSNQACFTNLRAEGALPVFVDASGGGMTLINPSANLRPAADQSGKVAVIGGQVSLFGLGGGWTVSGADIARVEVGFMPAALSATFVNCAIGQLDPADGATQGSVVLRGTSVAAGRISAGRSALRSLVLADGSVLTPVGGRLTCATQTVTIAAGAAVSGDLVANDALVLLDGHVAGTLEVGAAHRVIVGDAGSADRLSGPWGPPAGPAIEGAWCKNLQLRVVRGSFTVGWRYASGAWRAITVAAG